MRSSAMDQKQKWSKLPPASGDDQRADMRALPPIRADRLARQTKLRLDVGIPALMVDIRHVRKPGETQRNFPTRCNRTDHFGRYSWCGKGLCRRL